jgi:hypothetical protein
MDPRDGRHVAIYTVGSRAGLLAARLGSGVLSSLLYGVSPTDPRVYASASALLLLVALSACWLPARRAARLDPVDALRAEWAAPGLRRAGSRVAGRAPRRRSG